MTRILETFCMACNREAGSEMCRLCEQLCDAEEAADEPESPLLLVGQAPSADGHGTAKPFDGRSGRRLARLMGLSLEAMLRTFETANLIPAYRGKDGKGDTFPWPEARAAACALTLPDPGYTLFVGGRVKDAFVDRFAPEHGWARRYFTRGWAPCEWVDWSPGYPIPPTTVAQAWIPHPSGIVLWWNDPANTRTARFFLHDVVRRCAPSAVSLV